LASYGYFKLAAGLEYGSLGMHVGFGALLFFGINPVLSLFLSSQELMICSAFLVLASLGIRFLRFSKFLPAFRHARSGVWGFFLLAGLLGPAESIIPILFKFKMLGMGFGIPIASYALGTISAGVGLLIYGRVSLNEPQWLARRFSAIGSRRMAVPAYGALVLGVSLFVMRVF
jgi:hypothetical protein